MDDLIAGVRRFQRHVYPQKRRHFARLREGQRPPYLFITCSDSRIQPAEFLQSDAGRLFIERSIGNLVPLPGSNETEAAAAVEYAVKALGVAHIIICGHAHCGAMKALLEPKSLEGMPTVQRWLANAEDTRAAVASKHAHLEGEELLDATIRENVIIQIEHVRALPTVAEPIASGKVKVHGWIYEFEHGGVEVYDAHAGWFVPMALAYLGSNALDPVVPRPRVRKRRPTA
jgi:carbonic anhydrase